MTRWRKVGLGVLAVLVVLCLITAVILQSDWFRDQVRRQIIAVAEDATGGKVEIGAFEFDWTHLRATLRNFVLHGTEPRTEAPLLQAKLVVVDLKLFAQGESIDLSALTITEPRANLILAADGSTNIPEPKVKPKPGKPTLETLVDLKVGHFAVEHGVVMLNARKVEVQAKGGQLRAQLAYNRITPGYEGRLSINPLQILRAGEAPVDLNIDVPLVMGKDRIETKDAKLGTGASVFTVNAVVEHFEDPRAAGQVSGRLTLNDARRLASLKLDLATAPDLPNAMDVALSAKLERGVVTVSSGKVVLGQSTFEASAAQFTSSLALGELGRLLKVQQKPVGTVRASGTWKLTDNGGYQVAGNVEGRSLGFHLNDQDFRGIGLDTAVQADPKRIDLTGLRLQALGAQVTGNGSLEELARFKFEGRVDGLLASALGKFPYDGVISGPVKATGNLKVKDTLNLQAGVRLNIAPGKGVPVTGKVNAQYDAAADLISVADSYVALPNSRVDLSGALNQQLQVKLVSRNLSDFQPLSKDPLPIELRGGTVQFLGVVTGKLSAPQVVGHLEATRFALEKRPFDRLAADVSASSTGVRIQNGALQQAAAQVTFNGLAGLAKWAPAPNQPLQLNASMVNTDLADLLAIAGQKDVPAKGLVNGTVKIGGTIGNPAGTAEVDMANVTAYDLHFDRVTANVDLADQQVRLTNAVATSGAARIAGSGTFVHPKDHWDTGTVQAKLASNDMPLQPFNARYAGTARVNGDFTGELRKEFRVTALNADVTGTGLVSGNRKFGDVTASAKTAGTQVDFSANSNFGGSAMQVTGQTRLEGDYPVDASAKVANFPVEEVVAQVKGRLTANARLTGTVVNPLASGDFNLTKAVIQDEPVDQISGQLTYNNQLIEAKNLAVVVGPSRVEGNGTFQHPKNDFEQGRFRVHVASNSIDLARIQAVQRQSPGLKGLLQLSADGAGNLVKLAKGSTGSPVVLETLTANLAARDLEADRKKLGDATVEAITRNGFVEFKADSNLGGSVIHGEGKTQLRADYPTAANLTFSNVTYAGLLPLMGARGGRPLVDALAEGQATVSGPMFRPDELTGKLSLSKLQVTGTPRSQAVGTKVVRLTNQGPIVLALTRQALKVESAHVAGPMTDMQVTGEIALNDKAPLNLQVNATTDLKLLEDFDRDIFAAGNVTLQATVRGTPSQPQVNGQLRLKDASVNTVSISNGISHANGIVQFNGTTAVLQNLTAESGGGRVQLAGYVGFGGGLLRYGLRANAGEVRVRTPEGASVVASANLNLTGTSERSVLGGTITINRIAFNPQSDFGSILSRSTPPLETPSAPSGPLAGMKLDVRIRTAPDLAVQSALAQNIQTDADLTLRGTALNPGMLGRLNITSGKLVFFGTEYLVNSGSVAFYNPLKIEPILDIDLQTAAQGVDVTLTVAGPVNNMKLTYRSDPPLQFDEIVGLLAAGRTPSSDSTILANQPTAPPQNLQQMGESAIVSQAIASPVASRLQRVFGISKLKIDPTFTGGSALPQARLTLQQQVASNVTFTYITDLTQANSQIVRVEWSLNPQWSAVATRDENGRFGIDFFLKKQFR